MISLEVSLPESVSNRFQKIKGFSMESTRNAANKVTSVINQTVQTAVEGTNKTVDTLSKTVEQAKDTLTQTTDKTVDTVSTVTGKAVNTLTETALQAGDSFKGSVEDTLQTAGKISNAASTSVENAIATLVERQLDVIKLWIDAHPVVSWLVKALIWASDRPIYSIIIILLTIFILWQLFKAIGSLVEKAWLSIFKAPFKLVIFLLKVSVKPFNKFAISKQSTDNKLDLNTPINTSLDLSRQDRLLTIVGRLEKLRQEQNDLLQELTSLIGSDKLPN